MLKFEKKDDFVPFVIRVRRQERKDLVTEANRLKSEINAKRPKKTKIVTKGDICTEALRVGFAAIRKRHLK